MPAPGEAMWLPEDIAWVTEWHTYEKALCKRCRTRESDWWDEQGNPLKKPKYEFSTLRCPGCKCVTLNWKAVEEAHKDDPGYLAGLGPCLAPFGSSRRQTFDDDDDDWSGES